jgi:hypothetical protein
MVVNDQEKIVIAREYLMRADQGGPVGPLALETNFQYRRNPALCQRTTVSGVTKMSDCLQPDQRRRATTQKSRSKFPRLGRGVRRFSTANC